MNIDIVDPLRLPQALKDRWRDIVAGNPGLSSPYFSLGFIETIARCRPGVQVAVLDDGAAFFPFQREPFGFGIARPVGSPISDYHGLIAPAGAEVDVAAVLAKAGLVGWEFNHVPADQAAFASSATAEADSPFISFDQWTGGSSQLREQTMRRLRKLEREVGPVEFEFMSADPRMLELCLQWKSDQYDRSRMYNILKGRNGAWIRASLAQIMSARDPAFCGVLSVLRAKGEPVAAHFGVRSGGVLHYWFPSFDIELKAYSPGTILIYKLTEAAAGAGVTTLDFGRGQASYKERLATGATPLIEGCVIRAPLAYKLLNARKTVARQLRQLARSRAGPRPADAVT